MHATIKDVARKARVSYATVSRALNGKYGVRASTRDRILAAARQMGYQPNIVARGLVTKRTLTIGLIVPDITNPFFPEVAAGVEETARQHGYGLLLCNSDWSRESERQYMRLLVERRVDGIIIAPIAASDGAADDPEAGIPVVYASSVPRVTRRSFVVIDNIRGGFLATKHLIEAGFSPIGYIGSAEVAAAANERLQGYREALLQDGERYLARYVFLGDMRQLTGYRLMKSMIDRGDRPRAVFAENDLMALGCIQAIRESGLRVPEDVAVVGFDDIPFASFPEVQLTTIHQPKERMGRLAVEILLQEMASTRRRRKARQIVLEPHLVVRRTG